jgi:pimeloyl-ACP methyl ester carboxylesterase
VIAGYSMGGIGTNEIAMAHPDLFARAITLAGAVGDRASLRNLRWVPTYLAGGVSDELVPVSTERAEALALEALGYRYRWVVYPGVDHVIYELADSFADAAKYMGHARRVRNPGRFSYTWVPHDETQAFPSKNTGLAGFRWTQQPQLGVTNTGDYWLRHLNARHDKADSAAVHAVSRERPQRMVRTHTAHNTPTTSGPGPGLVSTQTWAAGRRSHRAPVIRLRLRNVRSLRVLLLAAGFHQAQRGKLTVTTDGPTRIRLGHRWVHVAKGHHVVMFRA